jgi:hypothetical protein
VEGANGLLRIFLQVVEKWRPIALVDSLENGQVDFQRFLDFIEHPPQAAGVRIDNHVLGSTIVQQVHVELRSNSLDSPA